MKFHLNLRVLPGVAVFAILLLAIASAQNNSTSPRNDGSPTIESAPPYDTNNSLPSDTQSEREGNLGTSATPPSTTSVQTYHVPHPEDSRSGFHLYTFLAGTAIGGLTGFILGQSWHSRPDGSSDRHHRAA